MSEVAVARNGCREMKYRFIVKSGGRYQNFLLVEDTKNGDLIVSDRTLHDKVDLCAIAKYPDITDLRKERITIHPIL
jgi:hypothetical protein